MALPLLVFDTNILLDVWLGRDNDQAVLLVRLAETGRVELVVPEYVLAEFRGTARRWVRDETERLNNGIRRVANEWVRSQELGAAAEDIRTAATEIEAKLAGLASQVDVVVARISSVARCSRTHTTSTSRATFGTSRVDRRIVHSTA